MIVVLNQLNMCDAVGTLNPGEDANWLQYLHASDSLALVLAD